LDAATTAIEFLRRRREFGFRQYGRGVEPLDPDHDWLREAIEECADQLVYLIAEWERSRGRRFL
jgi:hypothetical protein